MKTLEQKIVGLGAPPYTTRELLLIDHIAKLERALRRFRKYEASLRYALEFIKEDKGSSLSLRASEIANNALGPAPKRLMCCCNWGSARAGEEPMAPCAKCERHKDNGSSTACRRHRSQLKRGAQATPPPKFVERKLENLPTEVKVLRRAEAIEYAVQRLKREKDASNRRDYFDHVKGATMRRCRHCNEWVEGGPTACVPCATRKE